MTIDYTQIKEVYSDIDKQVVILKSLLEKISAANKIYHPLITFIGPDNKPTLAITTPSAGTLAEDAAHISDALHLYPALVTSAAIVSVANKVSLQDGTYDCLTLFIVSSEYGYILTLPYTHTSSSTIIWHDDKSIQSNILDCELEDELRDFVGMLFMFSHMPVALFSIAETLSYLSFKNYTIMDFRNKYSYFEMSPQ